MTCFHLNINMMRSHSCCDFMNPTPHISHVWKVVGVVLWRVDLDTGYCLLYVWSFNSNRCSTLMCCCVSSRDSSLILHDVIVDPRSIQLHTIPVFVSHHKHIIYLSRLYATFLSTPWACCLWTRLPSTCNWKHWGSLASACLCQDCIQTVYFVQCACHNHSTRTGKLSRRQL